MNPNDQNPDEEKLMTDEEKEAARRRAFDEVDRAFETPPEPSPGLPV